MKFLIFSMALSKQTRGTLTQGTYTGTPPLSWGQTGLQVGGHVLPLV